jgi:NADH:ubiquinone oxidoreductase subunit F (NADH-binding)
MSQLLLPTTGHSGLQGPRTANRLPRLLPVQEGNGSLGLVEHLFRHGPLPRVGRSVSQRAAAVEEVARAGLVGRGGAGFPTARKLAAVMAARGRPLVVVNGTEGEPASAKDKVLLTRAPHLVLDGAALAAAVVGAAEAVVVCNYAVRAVVAGAVAERRRAGTDDVRFRVVTAADRFVAGEASAAVNWIERGTPLPTRTPPRLAERGVSGRPTLVQNVETLAHLALVMRHGAAWYRKTGTEEEPGTTLVTLLGALQRSGVHEIELGTPIVEVLRLAGGPSAPLQALLIGGYFGTWVAADAAMTLPFSTAALAPLGASVGAGTIAALPADACGLVETARVARYLAGESAGQCGPCVFGLPAIAAALERLAVGADFHPEQLRRWLGQVDGRGACRHPDGVVRLVDSALRTFTAEISEHARGWCCGTGGRLVLPIPGRSRT